MRTTKPEWQAQPASYRLVMSSWVFHLFVAAVIIVAVFLRPPNIFSGDTDTARNYLNTIVSSLSTILALCISIILVAIQLTASNYTHRVLDFFMRLPFNASLFLVYLVTIVHSFVLMAKIRDPEPDPLPVSLRPEMSADLVLVVICFLSMLVYMWAVVQLLKPERIIELILRDYRSAYARGKFRAALDNVEQICDIAKRAASFSDSVTGMRCTQAMLRIAADLPLPRDGHDTLLEIHSSLVDQWVEMVGVTVKERETGLLYAVLDSLQVQGEHYVRGRAWPAAELVIRAYRHLVFNHLLADGQVYYADKVANRLHHLAHEAAKQGDRGQMFCLRTWNVIRVIGESTFTERPSSVSSLLGGFLLNDEFHPTLQQFADSTQRTAGMVLYFQLWKAFAAVGMIRDVARWAMWWRDRATDGAVRSDGECLAALVAVHLDRPDVIRTLCNVWGTEPAHYPVQDTLVRYSECLPPLFDGWPYQNAVRRLHALSRDVQWNE